MIYVRVYDGVMMVVGGDVDSFCRVFLVLVTVFGGDERTLVPDKARARGHRLDGGVGRQSDVAESVEEERGIHGVVDSVWWAVAKGREDDYHLAPARVTFLPR
jgi:hypothetical protein